MQRDRSVALLCFGVCSMLAGAGCASHATKMSSTMGAYTAGQYVQAETSAADLTADHGPGDNDRLLYLLEAGQILTATGKASESQKYLAEAQEIVAPYLDEKSDVSVSQTAASTILNPTVATYVGTGYDRVMMSTLQATNAMLMSDPAAARVEFNRARNWQEDLKLNNARRIEEAQKSVEEEGSSQGFSTSSVTANANVSAALDRQYGVVRNLRGYAGYVVPYTQHLSGVFRLSLGTSSDANQAASEFRQVAGVLTGPAKEAVLEDVARARSRSVGANLAPSTYVYFMTGLAPSRDQFTLRFPVPIGGKIIWVVAAFPTLELHEDYVSSFAVDGAAGKAVTITDMDGVVGQAFSDALPAVIAQSVVSAAIKGAGQYAMNEALGGWGGLAGAVLTELTTAADLRAWETLPKQIQYLRLDTPGDGKIRIKGGGRNLGVVEVSPGKDNVVWVTVPSSSASPARATAALWEAQ